MKLLSKIISVRPHFPVPYLCSFPVWIPCYSILNFMAAVALSDYLGLCEAWGCGRATRMIVFITRFIFLLFLMASFALNILIFSIGEPTEDKWVFLVETTRYEIPIAGIIAISAAGISFIIALWMSIAVKRKENHATRSVKKIAEPDFTKQLKKTSGSLKKALRDAHELIETQRSSLQRLSNEKVETNDAIVQERLLAHQEILCS